MRKVIIKVMLAALAIVPFSDHAYGRGGDVRQVDFDQGKMDIGNVLNTNDKQDRLGRCLEQMRSAVSDIPISEAFRACQIEPRGQMLQCIKEMFPFSSTPISTIINLCQTDSRPEIVACAQMLRSRDSTLPVSETMRACQTDASPQFQACYIVTQENIDPFAHGERQTGSKAVASCRRTGSSPRFQACVHTLMQRRNILLEGYEKVPTIDDILGVCERNFSGEFQSCVINEMNSQTFFLSRAIDACRDVSVESARDPFSACSAALVHDGGLDIGAAFQYCSQDSSPEFRACVSFLRGQWPLGDYGGFNDGRDIPIPGRIADYCLAHKSPESQACVEVVSGARTGNSTDVPYGTVLDHCSRNPGPGFLACVIASDTRGHTDAQRFQSCLESR